MTEVVVFGAGGHGQVVADAARCAGWTVLGFLDDQRPQGDDTLLGPVLGGRGWCRGHREVAIALGIGNSAARRQLPHGLNEKPFTMLKFRTVREPRPRGKRAWGSTPTNSRRWAARCATSLGELPTLWNVLKGEMSLVGPRPLLMEYLERYMLQQHRRH